jgi:hypothetical protein
VKQKRGALSLFFKEVIMEKRKIKYLAFKRLIGRVRSCNLCSEVFTVRGSFERICPECKKDNEEYKYSDWMHEGAFMEQEETVPAPRIAS